MTINSQSSVVNELPSARRTRAIFTFQLTFKFTSLVKVLPKISGIRKDHQK